MRSERRVCCERVRACAATPLTLSRAEQNRVAVRLSTDCPSDVFAAYTHQTSIWPLSVLNVSSAQRERDGEGRGH